MKLKLVDELTRMATEVKPLPKPPKVMCFGCGRLIMLLYAPSDKPWRDIWDNGIVSKIIAGYGSKFDGNEYLLGVCDTCIEHNVRLRRVILLKEGT